VDSGLDIEFGAGGLMVDDEMFVMLNPSTPEVWDHKFVAEEWAPTIKPVQG